ncbi:hypothetical protein BDR04DRAFT_104019 [Suillus decipiens]|nr:hypothetical protein BDR04DRAFT_104019 [Suillus decipiens]
MQTSVLGPKGRRMMSLSYLSAVSLLPALLIPASLSRLSACLLLPPCLPISYPPANTMSLAAATRIRLPCTLSKVDGSDRLAEDPEQRETSR